jgi:hypothetical protein
MKYVLAAILALATMTANALAADDKPGADWMTREQVTEQLQARGYTNITSLKADDGRWEGKGVKDGKIMEFHVDPRSGALTKEELDD